MWPCKYARVPIICFGQRLVFLVWAVSYCTVLKLQEESLSGQQSNSAERSGFSFYCLCHFKMVWLFTQNQKPVS